MPVGERNLHVVVATVGRPTCASVLREALERERRLARLTVVTQCREPITGAELRDAAHQSGVTVTEIRLPSPIGPCAARHVGVREGDEEFVVFLDDDLRFLSGSLSGLVDRCVREGLGGASGVVHVAETGLPSLLAKTVLHRSIFRDPRPWAGRVGRSVRSPILSGGMTVFRHELYVRCAPPCEEFGLDAVGEDVELSFAISRHASLVVDPSVRFDNLTRRQSIGPADATARAYWRLARYRSFADRHAMTPRHWLAYGAVLAGVWGRSAGAGTGFHAAARREVRRAIGQACRSGLQQPLGIQRGEEGVEVGGRVVL